MIEQFSKAQFEEALTVIFKGNVWDCDGYRGEELRYHVMVRNGVFLLINSSIGRNGIADSTGQNSIRVWLATEEGKPLAKKEQAYVTRVTGWQQRLDKTIKMTIEHASALIESPTCPTCSGPMVERTRRSDNSKFWGCARFPTCKGTRNFVKSQTAAREHVEAANKQPLQPELPLQQPEPVKVFNPSVMQLAIFNWVSNPNNRNSSLVVEALAGSGKTTTGVEMLKLLPHEEEVAFIAFNKHIAVELEKRAPKNVKVSTYHSLGYTPIRQAFGNVTVDEDKVYKILASLIDKDIYGHVFGAVKQLVSLVKANLTGTTEAEIIELADHYGIEMNGDSDLIFELVDQAIIKSIHMHSVIDYDDMCWFPVALKLPMKRYDTIFIDEAQDTNKVQIALALKSVKENGRIIAVGDRHQSLYGFRGADVNAIPNLIASLNATTLPLSITYRNPKCVVRMCNEKFANIPLEAAEWAKEGAIINMTESQAVELFKPGDMVLCRCNAPLVGPAFALIRKGIKAVIRGRDIGKNLQSLVKKMKSENLLELLKDLTEYRDKEVSKLTAANKNTQAQALIDKVDTIIALTDGIDSIPALLSRIDGIFSDDVAGVVFSSVHRAKGLEADMVYILQPELMPHPMAKQDWEKEQERNIQYVAFTRTKDTLVFVS